MQSYRCTSILAWPSIYEYTVTIIGLAQWCDGFTRQLIIQVKWMFVPLNYPSINSQPWNDTDTALSRSHLVLIQKLCRVAIPIKSYTLCQLFFWGGGSPLSWRVILKLIDRHLFNCVYQEFQTFKLWILSAILLKYICAWRGDPNWFRSNYIKTNITDKEMLTAERIKQPIILTF